MIKNIYKLNSYLLLNSYSLKSIGLYNGKAGLSLCLFEMAKYLQDESIEEHAFELLQESLVLGEKKNDITFEGGLSGIGFVLLYLIQNGFIDADFEELFGEYVEIILSNIEKETHHLNKMLSYIRFLAPLYQLNKSERIEKCILEIKNAKEEELGRQLSEFSSIECNINKLQFQNEFINYLKIISTHNLSFLLSLIECYCTLFQKDKFASSFEVSFYLKRFLEQNQDINANSVSKIIKDNEKQSLRNIEIYPKQFPLAVKTDLLYLLSQNLDKYEQYILLLEKDLFEHSAGEFQKNLLNTIPRNKFAPGYETGIARFLLYFVYNRLKDEGKDVGRFETIFI